MMLAALAKRAAAREAAAREAADARVARAAASKRAADKVRHDRKKNKGGGQRDRVVEMKDEGHGGADPGVGGGTSTDGSDDTDSAAGAAGAASGAPGSSIVACSFPTANYSSSPRSSKNKF